MNLNIPITNGQTLTAPCEPGKPLFVLGANGAGKSALIQKLFASNSTNSYRVPAHRPNYFNSERPGMSPQQRAESGANIRNADKNENSRWLDHHGSERPSISVFDLIDSENRGSREIARAVRADDESLVQKLKKIATPLEVLNRIFRLANINVQISISDADSQILATRLGGTPYLISRLSDGERNAVLLAADILVAQPGTLMIIDEPERHLHQSIIGSLLSALFKHRADLIFVVATHDLTLPVACPKSTGLLLRGCTFENNTAVSWDCDLLDEDLPESLKIDILGARRNILFVEGVPSCASLDRPLYSTVFPDITVLPKNSCGEVQNCVRGINGAKELAWVKAWGIVDGDAAVADSKGRLARDQIYALSLYSVESLYYHPSIQRHVADNTLATKEAIAQALDAAARDTVTSFRPHINAMAIRVVEKLIKEKIRIQTPGSNLIESRAPVRIDIDVAALLDSEATKLQKLMDSEDVATLISRYPVRETGALLKVAKRLGFKTRDEYEAKVLEVLLKSDDARNSLLQLLGPLGTAICPKINVPEDQQVKIALTVEVEALESAHDIDRI